MMEACQIHSSVAVSFGSFLTVALAVGDCNSDYESPPGPSQILPFFVGAPGSCSRAREKKCRGPDNCQSRFEACLRYGTVALSGMPSYWYVLRPLQQASCAGRVIWPYTTFHRPLTGFQYGVTRPDSPSWWVVVWDGASKKRGPSGCRIPIARPYRDPQMYPHVARLPSGVHAWFMIFQVGLLPWSPPLKLMEARLNLQDTCSRIDWRCRPGSPLQGAAA